MIFKQLLQLGAIDVCQIDSCRLAGVNEILSVLMMSAKFGIPVCPHAGGVGMSPLSLSLTLADDQDFVNTLFTFPSSTTLPSRATWSAMFLNSSIICTSTSSTPSRSTTRVDTMSPRIQRVDTRSKCTVIQWKTSLTPMVHIGSRSPRPSRRASHNHHQEDEASTIRFQSEREICSQHHSNVTKACICTMDSAENPFI